MQNSPLIFSSDDLWVTKCLQCPRCTHLCIGEAGISTLLHHSLEVHAALVRRLCKVHRDKTSPTTIPQSPLPAVQPQLLSKAHFLWHFPRWVIAPGLSYQNGIWQLRKGRWWDEAQRPQGSPREGSAVSKGIVQGSLAPGHWGTAGSCCSITPHVPFQQ